MRGERLARFSGTRRSLPCTQSDAVAAAAQTVQETDLVAPDGDWPPGYAAAMRTLSVVLVALALCACDKEGGGTEQPAQPNEGGLLESIDESGEEIGGDIERGLDAAAEAVGESMGADDAPAPEESGEEG